MSRIIILSIFYVYDVEKNRVFFVLGHVPNKFPEFSASQNYASLLDWIYLERFAS